jgi:uncharacterized coiled-coil protein SlyX
MSPDNTDLDHRLTKLELLNDHIENHITEEKQFRQKLDDKLDDIALKIESLKFYEKTIEKMESQVATHDKKIDKLYVYIKIMAGLFVLASGGSAGLIKLLIP